MLFSQPQIVAFLSQTFECAWESVRPVPHVTIDFGNGHALERTLHGNIVSYFCTPEGEVFDLLPGLVDPQEYLRRLDQASRLNNFARMVKESPELLRLWDGRKPAVVATPEVTATGIRTPDLWREFLVRWHRALLAREGPEKSVGGDPLVIPDLTKIRVERRIDESIVPLSASDAAALREDSRFNRRNRYPLASRLWLEHPFALPAEITNEVYRKVLGVDLEDPYLGLAPEILGGEPGRSETSAAPGEER